MSETDKALADALATLIENMGASKDFVLEQAPEVIQQLVAYHTISSIVGLFIGAGLLWGSVFFFKKLYAMGKAARDLSAEEIGGVFGCAGCVIGGVVGLCFVLDNFDCLLKLVFAPKVFLLEYAARLM